MYGSSNQGDMTKRIGLRVAISGQQWPGGKSLSGFGDAAILALFAALLQGGSLLSAVY